MRQAVKNESHGEHSPEEPCSAHLTLTEAMAAFEIIGRFFPEIGTDENLNGADAVNRLSDLRERAEEILSHFVGGE